MYHNTYPTSLLLTSVHSKSPVIFTYGDISLIALDHFATLTSYTQLPSLYSSQIALDSTNMKRNPMNLVLQNVESYGYIFPNWRRRDYLTPERHLFKGSIDSSSTCDSSRSSTPSSGITSSSEGNKSPENSPKNVRLSPYKRQRRNSNATSVSNGHLVNHRHTSFNQRYPLASSKKFSHDHLSLSLHSTVHGDEWNRLSQGIWRHYIENRQREETYIQKMSLKNIVYDICNCHFPLCALHVVGSSVNGLGTNTSDMDMCLMVSLCEIDQQTEALHFLRYAQNVFNQYAFVKSTELITAKVPILKFTDKEYSIQVDFNVNNHVGIWNTSLIKSYCLLDRRVQPLVLTIKKWAQDCNINNAKDMTLSSYSLVLMVIHYLQCGCSPPVLPCLHKMYPKMFFSDYHCRIRWFDPKDEFSNFRSKNSESLGELLFGFFDYFSNSFNFDREVMSVRLGGKLPKHVAMNFRSTKNKRGHWKYICIEEPFNRTNTACAVYDADSFKRIYAAFNAAWVKLKADKEISVVLKL